MFIIKTTISAKATAPFRLLHMTDNHITLADSRDDAEKMKLAKRRALIFDGENSGQSIAYFLELIAYAKENRNPILYTGDLIDFVSKKNLEYVKESLQGIDYLLIPGNHEFSQYVGEAYEDEAYKMQSFDSVQAAFHVDLSCNSRIINGVNFVGLDNSYYQFTSNHLAFFKAEVKKEYPIILFLHNPLFTEALYDEMIFTRNNPCAYLVGCPEEKMKLYSKDRYQQQMATPDTHAFLDYFYRQTTVIAVIAGHLHFPYEGELSNGIMQYVTGAGYQGMAREITFLT
jgi:Calcineurin-like phosphoesterase.